MASCPNKILMLALVLIVLCSALSWGTGFGVYGAYDFLIGSLGYLETSSSDFNRVKIVQAGLLLDTCMARDRLFNYRLQLGLDFSTAHYYDTTLAQQVDMDIWEILITNTFGFGLIRGGAVRLWAGPQVGVGFGFEPALTHESYYTSLGNFFEFDLFLGLAVGININLGDTVSLCADVDLRIHEDLMAAMGADSFFIGYLIKASANVAIVFRIDDRFNDDDDEEDEE